MDTLLDRVIHQGLTQEEALSLMIGSGALIVALLYILMHNRKASRERTALTPPEPVMPGTRPRKPVTEAQALRGVVIFVIIMAVVAVVWHGENGSEDDSQTTPLRVSENSTDNASGPSLADFQKAWIEPLDPVAEVASYSEPNPEDLAALQSLLVEFDGFVNSDSFEYYGFARGGPHYSWMNRLEAAIDTAWAHGTPVSWMFGDLSNYAISCVFGDPSDSEKENLAIIRAYIARWDGSR